MNVIKIEHFGEIEALRLGFGPVVPPMMTVLMYFLDGLAIDTAQRNMERYVLEWLKPKKLEQIVLTHHHEDHSGNAAILHKHHHIPVAGHPLTVKKMRCGSTIFPYQRFLWGTAKNAKIATLEQTVETGRFKLQGIHTPGHSKDHMVFFEEAHGWLFSGDLFLGERIKYFRSDENITDQIDSLKKVLKFDFDALFCAHNPQPSEGKNKLSQKLQFLEDIVGKVQRLHQKGLSEKKVIKKLDPKMDTLPKLITFGNVSYANMIRSVFKKSVAKI